MSRMAELKKIMHKRKLPKEKDNDFSLHDIYDKAINSKIFQRLSTGLVFDHSMSQHLCLWDQNYPECPDRFMKILERCNELKLVDRCKIIESRFAEEEELLLQHSEQQIEFLKSTENIKDIEKLEELSSRYDAVYFHPVSFEWFNNFRSFVILFYEHFRRRDFPFYYSTVKFYRISFKFLIFTSINSLTFISSELKILKKDLRNNFFVTIVQWHN